MRLGRNREEPDDSPVTSSPDTPAAFLDTVQQKFYEFLPVSMG